MAERRDVQTQIKHRILERYLGSWGGIILSGLKGHAAQMFRRSGRRLKHHFVYVDCFAHTGRYSGNVEDYFLERDTGPVPGSPLIGIRALDRSARLAERYEIDLRVNAVLIERDSKTYDTLLDTLSDAGLAARVRETRDLSGLPPGGIATINEDCTGLVDRLVEYTSGSRTKAFYLIDPWGPSGIPYDFVRSIVRGSNHDTMINFSYQDLEKKGGLLRIVPYGAHVAHWTAAFGSEEWIEICQRIEGARADQNEIIRYLGLTEDQVGEDPLFDKQESTQKELTEFKERQLVTLYRNKLIEMDNTLHVKSIRLRFPDRERPMFYLFVTTHDPTGALRLNEVLQRAGLLEFELRYIRRIAKAQERPSEAQMRLFSPIVPDVPEREQCIRPSVQECANDIAKRFAGRTVTRREIYQGLADDIYFPSEVDNAIKWLKRDGRAEYDDKKFSHSMPITITEA